MLGVVFWQDAISSAGKMPSHADTAIKVSTSTGTVLGQVGFGKQMSGCLHEFIS
jgi:PHS family inorganic phosphate transporter-like MFS transporter